MENLHTIDISSTTYLPRIVKRSLWTPPKYRGEGPDFNKPFLQSVHGPYSEHDVVLFLVPICVHKCKVFLVWNMSKWLSGEEKPY